MKRVSFTKKKYRQRTFISADATKFRRAYPEYKHLTHNELLRLTSIILEEYRDTAVANIAGVELPNSFGIVSLQYAGTDSPILNRKLIRETGIPDLEHLSLNTNGKQGKIVWNSRSGYPANKYAPFLRFQAHKTLTKKAHKAFKEFPNKFKIVRCQQPKPNRSR